MMGDPPPRRRAPPGLAALDTAVQAEAPSYSFSADGAFSARGVTISGAGLVAPRLGSVALRAADVTLGAVLGHGASSVVHRAVHVPTGTALALKAMPVLDKAHREQLMRELSALAGCSCAALTALVGAYCAESTVYVALELMDVGSLEQALGAWGGPLPEAVVAACAFQVLVGLQHLRGARILHRDVKPSNVLLDSTGAVKLSDFGLSLALDTSLGAGATFVGTSRYMVRLGAVRGSGGDQRCGGGCNTLGLGAECDRRGAHSPTPSFTSPLSASSTASIPSPRTCGLRGSCSGAPPRASHPLPIRAATLRLQKPS